LDSDVPAHGRHAPAARPAGIRLELQRPLTDFHAGTAVVRALGDALARSAQRDATERSRREQIQARAAAHLAAHGVAHGEAPAGLVKPEGAMQLELVRERLPARRA
jgi:hypothetical protein